MIELKQARELLKAAVETQGADFVYNPDAAFMCMYEPLAPGQHTTPDDPRAKTGCLVGVALSLAGETRHVGYGGGVMSLVDAYPDMLSGDAADYLQAAQIKQDAGETWGVAFATAEEDVALILVRTPE